MTALSATAQEKKAFTLEDVIPGGENYFNLVPKSMPGLQWWGDVCVRTDVEAIQQIDLKNGKEKPLVTLEEVNAALSGNNLPYKPEYSIKPLRTLSGASLPWGDRKVILFSGKAGNEQVSENYMFCYDFGKKQITNMFRIPEQGAANYDFCKANGYLAYTAGDHLYIANQGETSKAVSPKKDNEKLHDIVYGQAVHRNEFGIYKGTFWSPKGTYLAFYRMDQSMVTDYPQVNTSTRIATLEPDKYPMAGMTSHQVTVGVYNVQSGKTVYLQAGDPTDRYFTNISWSPDEKNIYVIELNRDQNHAQLVRYNAETGAKEAVLYEETHPKYVEPQQPLLFLPWDSSKFLYQSQRDGFNHLYLFDTASEVTPVEKEAKAGGTYKESVKVTPLTQGDWLVQQVLGFNPAKKQVIIGSTEISPLQTNIFTVNVNDGKRTLIGKEDGMHYAQLSASGTYLIDNFNSFSVPRDRTADRYRPAD